MGDFPCLDCRWKVNDKGMPRISAERVVTEAGVNRDAGILTEIYDEFCRLAGKKEPEKALAQVEKGLAAWDSITPKNHRHDLMRINLLLGKVWALNGMGRHEEAWESLTQVCGPSRLGLGIPIDLLIQWIQRGASTCLHLGRWLEALAMINLMAELRWGPIFKKPGDQRDYPGLKSLFEEYGEMIEPTRLDCFEGLMQSGQFHLAEQVANDAREFSANLEDPEPAIMWRDFGRMAQQKRSDFKLQNVSRTLISTDMLREDGRDAQVYTLLEEATEDELDTNLQIYWEKDPSGAPCLGWMVAPPFWHSDGVTSLDASSLAVFSKKAAVALDREDYKECIALHDQAIKVFGELDSPRPVDRFVWWFSMTGKGEAQYRLALQGRLKMEMAWESLWQAMSPEARDLSRPLDLVLQWAMIAVPAGIAAGREPEVLAVFGLVMELKKYLSSKSPRTADEQQYLMQTVRGISSALSSLMSLAFGEYFKKSTKLALEWVRSLQKFVEAEGEDDVKIQELLYRALEAEGDSAAAREVARHMVQWVGDYDDGLLKLWQERAGK